MPSATAARDLADRWLEAWNGHDLDAILAHYADEVQLVSPLAASFTADGSGALDGKEALRSYFLRTVSAYPDLHFELESVLAGVGSVAILYRGVNELRVAEVMELDDDGKVRRVLAHYARP